MASPTKRLVRWTLAGAGSGAVVVFVSGMASGDIPGSDLSFALGYVIGGAFATAAIAFIVVAAITYTQFRSTRTSSAPSSDSTSGDGADATATSTSMPHHWPQQAHGVRDYIGKHWRGQFSLARSFWVNNFLVNVFVAGALTLLEGATADRYASIETQAYIALLFIAISILIVALAVWQIVGIWRSAGNRIANEGLYGWSVVARIICVFGVLQILFIIVNVSKDLEGYASIVRVAVGIDQWDATVIRVIDNGSGILIEGPFSGGVIDRFRDTIDAAPDAYYVQLESEGGFMQVGIRLHREILEHELVTFVRNGCYSACTLAFIAGNPRILADDAELGFHNAEQLGDSVWADEIQLEEEHFYRTLLRDRGVSDSFIEHVQQTPFEDIWIPDRAMLARSGVITHVLTSDGVVPVADVED